jgi:hypothetical protein
MTTPDPFGSAPTGPDPFGPDPVSQQNVSPDAVRPDAVRPESVSPEPARPRPAEKGLFNRFPWWVWAGGAAALIVIIVLAGVLVTRKAAPEALPEPTIAPEASPSAEASPSPTAELPEVVVVPDVTTVSVDKGTALMTDAFLAPNVRYKQDPRNNGKVEQSIPAGTQVPRGATVDIIIHVSISVPDLQSPAANSRVNPNALPALTWRQSDTYVKSWRVYVYQRTCFFGVIETGIRCSDLLADQAVVKSATYTPSLVFALPPSTANTVYHNGIFYWRVFPLDDFGTPGPGSASWGASVVDQPRQT